ncbi:LysM-containing receptor-like kinase 4 [Hibiscus trionum]|uniref:LysM-containing receptor-like kinase 4 n=1 Tax=Hibiscus trionum TaxID=183268 RepID=A0A9W7IF87_HIBTR|nr:LysM-containing receptor-like kinase 4 [Hibiscus trionum]
MVFLPNFIGLCVLVFLIDPISSLQSYDESNCSATSQVHEPNYLCTPEDLPCHTYVVYRVQKDFESMSSIASLFNLTMSDLLEINHMTEADSTDLKLRKEIIIPVECSCVRTISQSIFMYRISSNTTSLASVACGVFEGLSKVQSLHEENVDFELNLAGDLMIKVPIRCACPDANQSRNGVQHLVTYPVLVNDHTEIIARKFGVPKEIIWNANMMQSSPTIFPLTTLLVPTKDVPLMNPDVHEDLPSSPRVASPFEIIEPSKKSKHLSSYIFLGLGLFAGVILLIASMVAFCRTRKSRNPTSFQLLSGRSSVSSNVSPDFLDRVSELKQSLTNFTLEELRDATEDFNEVSKAGKAVYRGKIGSYKVAIEQMNSDEAARRVFCILTKINHLNIVKIEGCCYGIDPYLVFEFAEYGSLRDCLSNANVARQLTWGKRTTIAFDIAVALHYIHYCTKPCFIHGNIHSKNVLITKDWRAKITGFTSAKPSISSEEDGEMSFDIDIFGFGVVLIELLSAKQGAEDGEVMKEFVNIFADPGIEGCSGYLKKLEQLMDPNMDPNYPLADALCLAFLAKACVESDPHHRPTMDNVIKALSRFS